MTMSLSGQLPPRYTGEGRDRLPCGCGETKGFTQNIEATNGEGEVRETLK